MADAFSIQVLTPEGKVWEGRGQLVNATGVEGGFGILARHQPMVVALGDGPLVITTADSGRVQFRVAGGVLEVTAFHDVLILADTAKQV